MYSLCIAGKDLKFIVFAVFRSWACKKHSHIFVFKSLGPSVLGFGGSRTVRSWALGSSGFWVCALKMHLDVQGLPLPVSFLSACGADSAPAPISKQCHWTQQVNTAGLWRSPGQWKDASTSHIAKHLNPQSWWHHLLEATCDIARGFEWLSSNSNRTIKCLPLSRQIDQRPQEGGNAGFPLACQHCESPSGPDNGETQPLTALLAFFPL